MAASTGSTARKGKAVEHLIAATCILASDGRLNVMTGMVDDEGVDLAFKATGGLRTVDIQVKARFLGSKRLSRGESYSPMSARPPSSRDRISTCSSPSSKGGPQPSGRFGWCQARSSKPKPPGVRPRAKGACASWLRSKEDSADKWTPYRMKREQLAPTILKVLSKLDGRA